MEFLFFGKKKHKKSNKRIEGINEIIEKEKQLDRKFQKPMKKIMNIDSEKSKKKPQRISKTPSVKNSLSDISDKELKEIMRQEMILNKNFQLPIERTSNKEILEKHERVQRNLSLPVEEHKGFFGRIFSGNRERKFDREKESIEKEAKNVLVKNEENVEKIEKKEEVKEVPVKNIDKKNKSVKLKNPLKAIKKQPTEEDVSVSRFKNGYVHTGIKGFDELFDKNEGIPEGISALIEGGPGSGKTVFCLATLDNLCRIGKKCLYMSFEESEEDLIHHMEKFGWDAKSYIQKGMLRIKRFDAIDVSRSIEALLSAAKKELLIEVNPVFLPSDFEPDFLVIDSLTSIASAFSGQESRFRIYMEQLFRYLEQHKITNFLVREVSSPTHTGSIFQEQGEAVSFLSDGIIVLYNVIHDSGKRESALEILKMRGTSFNKKIVKMEIINGKGLFVYPNKILTKTGKQNFKLT